MGAEISVGGEDRGVTRFEYERGFEKGFFTGLGLALAITIVSIFIILLLKHA